MVNTINEARTPGELAAWLRQWADGVDASDHLDDNDARQLAEAVERVCADGNTAAMRKALDKAECVLLVAARFATDNAFTDADARENLRDVDWDGALAEIDAALAAPPEPLSNAAALREALLKVLECYKSGAIRTEYNDPDSWRHDDELCYLKDDVEAALSAPARNCDTVRDGREALGWCRESVAVERDAAYDRGMRDAIRWLLTPAEKGGAQ